MKYLDRITEKYEGTLGEAFQKKQQRRISAICDSAIGSRVLDVGCSQGIASVLLARAGYEVIGVDYEEESIAYARNYLEKEDEKTRANLEFVRADFLSYDFGSQQFDTVVMTELLEHVDEPDAFVAKASSLLAQDGRVIVSVPFGINDWPDHKRTYYLTEIYQSLAECFSVTKIEYMDDWILLLATNSHHAQIVNLDTKTFADAEEAFFRIERSLRDSLNDVKPKLQDLRKSLPALRERAADYKDQVQQQKEDIARLQVLLAAQEEELRKKTEVLQSRRQTARHLVRHYSSNPIVRLALRLRRAVMGSRVTKGEK